MNMVHWNLGVLNDTIQRLDSEKESLTTQRTQMREQQSRVDANWQSPAGQQYQGRLQQDMETIYNVIASLDMRIDSLRRVHVHYTNCEGEIRSALGRLPRQKR